MVMLCWFLQLPVNAMEHTESPSFVVAPVIYLRTLSLMPLPHDAYYANLYLCVCLCLSTYIYSGICVWALMFIKYMGFGVIQ